MLSNNALRRLEPFASEIFIATTSLWVAFCLWTAPADFERFMLAGVTYNFVRQISDHERWWAAFTTIAALLKIIGLICILDEKLWPVSIVLRKIGFAMSFAWWTILGVSVTAAGFRILGFLPLAFAARAVWLTFQLVAPPRE